MEDKVIAESTVKTVLPATDPSAAEMVVDPEPVDAAVA
jgi:hypothetical protein